MFVCLRLTDQVPPSRWQGVGPDSGNKPVVVHETSDNPGGGATGDATFLLQVARGPVRANWSWDLPLSLTDPRVTYQATSQSHQPRLRPKSAVVSRREGWLAKRERCGGTKDMRDPL